MKFLKITAAILFLAILTACNSGQVQQASETVSETETSAVTTSATTATTTETETEPLPETESAEIAEETDNKYVEVSARNEFIDFEFIENYQGTTDIGDLADKAVEFLKTTDFYSDSMNNISEFSDKEFSDYIKDGVIVPKFSIAYPNDYDGDGRTETFIMVDMPYFWSEFRPVIRNILIFADSGGEMEVIGDYSYFKPERYLVLLNYGKYKQIIFGGDGTCGADMHTVLYGVKDGKAVEHFGVRGSFKKENCFLTATDYYGDDRFMYFDTVENEYRNIVGVPVSIDEMKAIDSENFFAEYYSLFEEEGFVYFELVSKNYYRVYRDLWTPAAVYKYENGKFTKIQDSGISSAVRSDSPKSVIDIDIDKAIAGMKPPAEPYVQVSKNNEFIDYNFILNYQGTTDIGGIADKAVEFVKTTEQYAKSMEDIGNFSYAAINKVTTNEEYAREQADKVAPYIDGGSIQPLVSAAYPADYDGDGKTETFIVVDIPYMEWSYPDVWSFLLFVGSSGDTTPTLLDFYEGYSASMLDYGKSKHLIFGGWDGMHSYASIYGVKDNKPVTLYDHCPGGYFRKTDCFLSVFGLQGLSDFMYFDTAALEYRVIKGVEISHAEMKDLDVSNTLCSDFGEENIDELPDYVEFHFIKPNYYLLDWGFPGSVLFTYENGVFTRVEDSNITRSSNGSDLDVIAEFDIEKAAAEMKPVSDPFSPISKDSEFIDFEFIKNYQGTTDIGGLADKAVQYINNSNAFEYERKNADKFSDEKFSEFFDSDGNLVPKLLTAYPNDYDGDGKTETFIIMEMPLYMENLKTAVIRAYLLFADSSGRVDLCKHLDGFDPQKDAVLLNYGKYKHILFYNHGDYDGGTGICIYGAADSREAVYHYGGVGSLKKNGCYLSVSDNNYNDYFMFFDTAAQKYITLLGKNYGGSMPAPLGTNQNAEIKPVQK
ncbi:MAG: hypothetical protein HDT25_07435 [Ruminococcus sp.]|nr:hypothetical protein [Ruminococcus sp.]